MVVIVVCALLHIVWGGGVVVNSIHSIHHLPLTSFSDDVSERIKVLHLCLLCYFKQHERMFVVVTFMLFWLDSDNRGRHNQVNKHPTQNTKSQLRSSVVQCSLDMKVFSTSYSFVDSVTTRHDKPLQKKSAAVQCAGTVSFNAVLTKVSAAHARCVGAARSKHYVSSYWMCSPSIELARSVDCVTVVNFTFAEHDSCRAPAYHGCVLCRNLSHGCAFYDYCGSLADDASWYAIYVFCVCSYWREPRAVSELLLADGHQIPQHSNFSFQFARQRRLKPKLSTVSWYLSLLLDESVVEPILLITHVSYLRYTFIFCYRLQKCTSLFR